MKYIKTFEKIISNSSTEATNHPLYELSKHLEKILKELKIIDNSEKFMTRLYFSKTSLHMNIQLSYSYEHYKLLEITLMKYDNMDNVGLRIKLSEYDDNQVKYKYTPFDTLEMFENKLIKYHMRKNKESVRFDFNMKDLNDIIRILNIEDIVEYLKIKKDINNYNL